MENIEQKYQKLASEYSKIRAQASVLKRAVIEEQNKTSSLRETLRNKETTLRKVEQEVDSLGFRNKQLEHRVESLQEDLVSANNNKKGKVRATDSFNTFTSSSNGAKIQTSIESTSDPILSEEFQKKILENAKLTSDIADKDAEIILYHNRVTDLEQQLSKLILENTESDKKLRKEIETLSAKNSDLESKVLEAASTLGSEDGLSVHSSDHTSIPISLASTDERIKTLEKESYYWRAQYEITKLKDSQISVNFNDEEKDNGLDIPEITYSKEQLLYNNFNRKFEKVFTEKFLSESLLKNCMIECKMLNNNLEALSQELERVEAKLEESRRLHQITEEDLTTTRINYEEQISVLTEQVISLSDQLANSK